MNKPSKTALLAALHRTLAHREYGNESFGPDNLASNFLPPHIRFMLRFKTIRKRIEQKINRILPGLHQYVIARTCFFDHLFAEALKSRTPQIVLLGAGYDSRAYRFSGLNTGTSIYELDIAPTQDSKKKSLSRTRIPVPNRLAYVPIDFNRESLADALIEAGYRLDRETLFLWEGVSYYLDRESVKDTLNFVSQQSHNQSRIAFDYIIAMSEESQRDGYGVKEFTERMEKHHSTEKLLFSLKPGEMDGFLKQRGLEVVDHMDNEAIENRFLLDENGSLLGPVTGHFRFVVASVRSAATPS